jgi:uncharacterized membrane protein
VKAIYSFVVLSIFPLKTKFDIPMKRNTFNNLGGLHSLFFCIGIYTVCLFFSIFVCSSVFYAINPKKPAAQQTTVQTSNVAEKPVYASIGK